MDIQFFITQMKAFLKPMDFVSILLVLAATQRLKLSVAKRFRPVLAFGLGYVVAAAWAIKTGGWVEVPFYGFVYGAGAAFTRQLWKTVRNKG